MGSFRSYVMLSNSSFTFRARSNSLSIVYFPHVPLSHTNLFFRSDLILPVGEDRER